MINEARLQWKIEKKKDTFKLTKIFGKMDGKGLLRFTTAGSVDDGKSTLIGRLLYDSKSIFEDQLESISEFSKKKGNAEIDLSLLTDGLRAEREQGITIDVAYRYFSTPKRKFIIADTPGHIQYTRNMVTGASTADLAVILIDVRNGVTEQTIRHTYIAKLLDLKHIIYCVNKMDLLNYKQDAFENVKTEIEELSLNLDVTNYSIIPISAKYGDNVVSRSKNMEWFPGDNLLSLLENLEISNNIEKSLTRFPVQYVIRPNNDEFHDFRGYAGRLSGGKFIVGQEVCVLPSMHKTKINEIVEYQTYLESASDGDSIIITLEDDIDISRGDLIVPLNELPNISKEIMATICWFNEKPLQLKGKYLIRMQTSEIKAVIDDLIYKIDINNLEKNYEFKSLSMNDIGLIKIRTANYVFTDDYLLNHVTGSFIIVDPNTNETVAAGMIQNS